ncbi:MAG TPA: hypothetical protein VMC84_09110 [Methanocella sp.]|nr:hypothetical protein [Methanocella sp.]HTY91321.1 hypothetical protein [Methanocella sp.]
MDILKKALIATLIVVVAIFSVHAGAQLTSTAYGFPMIVQSSNTVAFQQDTANALDYQDVDISFPVACDGLPFGAVSLAFPNIHQTSLQTQSVTHTSYAQTNDFAEFAYPFVGVGAVGLPGFGFGC